VDGLPHHYTHLRETAQPAQVTYNYLLIKIIKSLLDSLSLAFFFKSTSLVVCGFSLKLGFSRRGHIYIFTVVIVGSLGSIPAGGNIFSLWFLYPKTKKEAVKLRWVGVRSALLCVLRSLKRRVLATHVRMARPNPL